MEKRQKERTPDDVPLLGRRGTDEPAPKASKSSAYMAYITRQGLKRYGFLSALTALIVVACLKGMPGHTLWPLFGTPLIVLFVCCFAPTLYYGAMLIVQWIDKMRDPQIGGPDRH